MPKPYIFISHSSQDKPAVAEIVDDLQAKGIHVWVDFDRLESGAKWLDNIQTAIDDCAGFLVILSKVSRRADWVMRECLYALQLRKPLYIALIDDVPLPLLLVDRQFNNFVDDYDMALADLLTVLEATLANPPKPTEAHPLPDAISPTANEDNFFAYLAQMDKGDELATLARDLYGWSQKTITETEFSGRFRPAFHAKFAIDGKLVSVFSILAYLRHPTVQIPFDYLRKYAPFTRKEHRLKILRELETLLPDDDSFERDRADRRPTIALEYLLGDAERLEKFKEIVSNIIEALRDSD